MAKLYCAYGSNLNQRQMLKRCPEAKFVGIGRLFGYELCFRGFSDSAYATVIEKEGEFVPVALYWITESDEASLDHFEGYPYQYLKSQATVEIGDELVSAMIYIMNPNRKVGLPSGAYYARIWDGYNDCGLDKQKLEEALEKTFKQFYAEALKNPRESWTFFQ